MRAHIIVDLGFGDSGKGLLTDFLVRRLRAGLVVRYNGGAQAGHNVVTADGRHHTFSQFGSGSFLPHVKTFLSRHVVIHPTALLVEGDLLQAKGVPEPFARIGISDRALVITPFHQALNRVREKMRGAKRHGSCGVGVGEAVEDSLAHPESRILAGDLTRPDVLRKKGEDIRRRAWEAATSLIKAGSLDAGSLREYAVFEQEQTLDDWIAALARIGELGLVMGDAVLAHWLAEAGDAVFEGAQGVLLDEDAGFHPYTTWSRCTSRNAEELLGEMAPGAEVTRIGVARTYAVRHGPGPLPTETGKLRAVVAEHNQNNEWQGAVRYGWFDAVLARYALEVNGGVDHLAVTHVDALTRLPVWKFCAGYEGFKGFPAPSSLLLEEREVITNALSRVQPMMQSRAVGEESVLSAIEEQLGQAVKVVSRGPRAEDVEA